MLVALGMLSLLYFSVSAAPHLSFQDVLLAASTEQVAALSLALN